MPLQEEKKPESNEDKFVSITEAAQINKVTRQAIYVAVQNGKLPAHKHLTRWMIKISDLEEYKRNKYSRKKSMYKGELLFDNAKGFYSVNDTAKKLGIKPQKIYYATRIGLLKASRRGSAWVIHIDDALEYKAKGLRASSKKEELSNRDETTQAM